MSRNLEGQHHAALVSNGSSEDVVSTFPPPLQSGPDPAILRLVRALARQDARDDHAQAVTSGEGRRSVEDEKRDLRQVFDRPAE